MFNIKVTPDQGAEYEVEVKQRDVLKWERNTGGNILLVQQKGFRLSDLSELAYYAAVRKDLFKGTLEQFEDSVEIGFEEVEDDTPNSE